jgi:hypothetical protein
MLGRVEIIHSQRFSPGALFLFRFSLAAVLSLQREYSRRYFRIQFSFQARQIRRPQLNQQWHNKALHPTAYSLRSCLAPASGGG